VSGTGLDATGAEHPPHLADGGGLGAASIRVPSAHSRGDAVLLALCYQLLPFVEWPGRGRRETPPSPPSFPSVHFPFSFLFFVVGWTVSVFLYRSTLFFTSQIIFA